VIDRQVFEHPGNSLATIFESAAEFGLAPQEIWETLVATPERLPDDVKACYLDEVSGALAERLIAKERGD
jgi:hypothetical protein